MSRFYSIIMNLTDSEQTTRIHLEIGARKWPMTIADSSIVAELMKDVMLAPLSPGPSVELEDGSHFEFCRTDHGANIGGTLCDRSDAIRLADDLRNACDDAEQHLEDCKAA